MFYICFHDTYINNFCDHSKKKISLQLMKLYEQNMLNE